MLGMFDLADAFGMFALVARKSVLVAVEANAPALIFLQRRDRRQAAAVAALGFVGLVASLVGAMTIFAPISNAVFEPPVAGEIFAAIATGFAFAAGRFGAVGEFVDGVVGGTGGGDVGFVGTHGALLWCRGIIAREGGKVKRQKLKGKS